MTTRSLVSVAALLLCLTAVEAQRVDTRVELGARPALLVADLPDGELKSRLLACLDAPAKRTAFSIGHRGAGLVYPEHTLEAYEAAYRMGAGTIECDVTFTKDLALVCRHAQNDLATTTDILLTPLASTCIAPFKPARLDANGRVRRPASAECRTSELTLAEFKTLRGKIDAFDPAAQTVEQFVAPRRAARPDLGAGFMYGTLLTHAESIALFKRLGVRMMPELKEASVRLPFNGITRDELSQKLIDEYRAAGVPPRDVYPQSFERRDVDYWIEHEPEYGRQAILLDNVVLAPRAARLRRYKAAGINIWGPALPGVLALDDEGRIVPSRAARAAHAAGLDIVTWTLERSGNLSAPNKGFYYRKIGPAVTREGDVLRVIDVLARDAGVRGVFSDWPATVSFYAGCAGLP
ncbi:MAG TPA: glycerophosphodiester phosphodiesterase family protein [Gammaproteobacteria bacterium]|nr:glycerophosphodiester phosphodiesterase family protein [Gammaproteobacteria bacterium]